MIYDDRRWKGRESKGDNKEYNRAKRCEGWGRLGNDGKERRQTQ